MTVDAFEAMLDCFFNTYKGSVSGQDEPGDYVENEWDLYHSSFVVTTAPENLIREYLQPAMFALVDSIQQESGSHIETRPYIKSHFKGHRNGLHIGVTIGQHQQTPGIFSIYILVKRS